MQSSRYPAYVFIACLSVFMLAFSFSCQRNKECDVVINVVDGNNSSPVFSATVHLYPPPGTNGNLNIQDQTGVTDAAGSVSFTFKLPAILQADITPISTSTLTAGSALVKLEEGKQVSKTIKLY
ncbi:MAG: hypothetical protein HY841_08540 [Bacteroidetes bacterium]|nr:hypothetical protein [Bacteroidota bacterium]